MKLLESIRFENGKFENLSFHYKRLNDSRKTLFGCDNEIILSSLLQAWTLEVGLPPSLLSGSSVHAWTSNKLNAGLYKCRITYSEQIENIELINYSIPKINSLKIVFDDQINYSHKYLNRITLEELYKQKGNCDDILIVKNGLITDTSYANIVFYNGKDWITPAKPLLKGTQRAFLLEKEIIKTADIRVEDLMHFEKVRLINAMVRFKDEIDIDIKNIFE